MKTQQFLIALGILSMVFTLLVVRHAAPVVTPDIPQPIVRGYHSDGIVRLNVAGSTGLVMLQVSEKG